MYHRLIALLAVVLLHATALAPYAHAQAATVEGTARADSGGAPVPFALVRLVSADTTGSPPAIYAQGITSADGRYRFGGVAAGRYRVQLVRIGFRPVLSDPVQVVAGETAQLALRVASQPIALPAVTVTAEGCVAAAALAGNPQIQTLWQQARDGASIREGLLARYRFLSMLREEGFEHTANGPTTPATLDRPLVSDPKWALSNAARIRSQRLARGYYAPNDGWSLPNELDVLHEDFLRTHCLMPTTDHGVGEVGLRFQPLRVRRDFLDVRGTIWLDSATYLVRRLELEYMDGEDSRGTVRLDFDDIAVAGGMLRMPVHGAYTMRPSRKNPARRTEGKLTFSYSGFEEVRIR